MNNKIFLSLLFGVLFSLSGFIYSQEITQINTSEAAKLIAKDTTIVILDVRTPGEYNSETGHLKNAVLIPVQELEQRIDELKKYHKKEIIVYCRTGHRSTNAAEILFKHGYKSWNMTGGITKWNSEKLPVVKEIK